MVSKQWREKIVPRLRIEKSIIFPVFSESLPPYVEGLLSMGYPPQYTAHLQLETLPEREETPMSLKKVITESKKRLLHGNAPPIKEKMSILKPMIHRITSISIRLFSKEIMGKILKPLSFSGLRTLEVIDNQSSPLQLSIKELADKIHSITNEDDATLKCLKVGGRFPVIHEIILTILRNPLLAERLEELVLLSKTKEVTFSFLSQLHNLRKIDIHTKTLKKEDIGSVFGRAQHITISLEDDENAMIDALDTLVENKNVESLKFNHPRPQNFRNMVKKLIKVLNSNKTLTKCHLFPRGCTAVPLDFNTFKTELDTVFNTTLTSLSVVKSSVYGSLIMRKWRSKSSLRELIASYFNRNFNVKSKDAELLKAIPTYFPRMNNITILNEEELTDARNTDLEQFFIFQQTNASLSNLTIQYLQFRVSATQLVMKDNLIFNLIKPNHHLTQLELNFVLVNELVYFLRLNHPTITQLKCIVDSPPDKDDLLEYIESSISPNPSLTSLTLLFQDDNESKRYLLPPSKIAPVISILQKNHRLSALRLPQLKFIGLAQEALVFNRLKYAILSHPTLKHFSITRETRLETDDHLTNFLHSLDIHP